MKIIKLEAENIKRLKAITITPDGNLVVVGGNNGHGKSSTLDSIEYALAGKGAICEEPIARGKKKAKTVCDLGDLIVTRTFTKSGGGTLTVANKDGSEHRTPQAILDALVGKLSFDPLSFATMNPGKRLETLKQVVGLDFSTLDEQREAVYDERTEVNRNGKSLATRFEELEEVPDLPTEEIVVSDLMKELRQREEINQNNDLKRKLLKTDKNSAQALESEIDRLTKQLLEIKSNITKGEKVWAELKDADEQEIREQITGAQNVNNGIKCNKERARLKNDLATQRKLSQSLTDKLTTIDKEKTDAMAAAKFPIDSLSFDETGVTYQDLPFDQASDAEKLRVSVAMGLAMNPKLKVLLIRNGSLLDADNLEMIATMAKENDAQVWIERVGKGKECSVVIEDGQIDAPGMDGM